MQEAQKELGRILVERGLVSPEDLDRHTAAAGAAGTPLAAVLADRIPNGQAEVLRVVAEKSGVPFLDPAGELPSEAAALRLIDRAIAERYLALPLTVSATEVRMAMADPFDRAVLGYLHKATGFKVAPLLAPREAVRDAIGAAYDGLDRSGRGAGKDRGGERVGVATPELHVNRLLAHLVEVGGSDLHLAVGTVPQLRVNGVLIPMDEAPRLTPDLVQSLVYSMLAGAQREVLEDRLELDFSHPAPGLGRFRVNAFFQRGSLGAVLRAIPDTVPSLDELNMPSAVRQFSSLPRGLVLVTGATGSGKSTTLASIIDLINSTRAVHIMTIEDPIEYLHRHKKSIVNQRELGVDTGSFAVALRQALRQDPDVIQVGELRDLETMATALTASETGHLVFATLHTQSAAQSIERMVDVFPPHQQQQVRIQLAGNLQAIIAQDLVPTVGDEGRVAAVEVLVATPAVRNLIRERKQHQIPSLMQSGAGHGMQTMDQALAFLVRAGRISMAEATERALDAGELRNLVGRR